MSLVQSATTLSSATGAKSLAYGSGNAAGNLLVAGLIIENNTDTVTTFADSQSNTWVALGTLFGSGNGYRQRIYYVKNCLGGTNTVTVTPTGTPIVNFQIYEYSGYDQTAPSDGSHEASGTNGTPDSGNFTTSADGDLIYCMISANFTTAVGSGFTARQGPSSWTQNMFGEDKTAGAAGTYSGFWTAATGVWLVSAAAFKTVGGAPGTGTGRMLLLGVG